jgi:hypothetical protein
MPPEEEWMGGHNIQHKRSQSKGGCRGTRMMMAVLAAAKQGETTTTRMKDEGS